MRVESRRVATILPERKRILNGRRMSKHIGLIKWASMPYWYLDYMLGRI